jgi:hypothetical protein
MVTMADSGAVRARRHRQHVAGNHALCRRDCGENRQVLRALPGTDEISARIPDFDPQRSMRELAEQLREACAANPADAVLAREYRLTLQALVPDKETDDELSGLLSALQR